MRKTALILMLLASTLHVATPTAGAATAPTKAPADMGSWMPMSLQIPVYKRLSLYSEIQPRLQRLPERHFTELQNRVGLSVDVTDNFSLTGGYFLAAHYNPTLNYENRIWEQATYSFRAGNFRIQNRSRLEQIWRETYEGASWRFRHQIKVMRPIGRTKWYVVGSEEPFFTLNTIDKGPEQGLVQNRLFVGMGRNINPYMRVECGYMNQFRNGQRGKPDQFNNLLIAQLAIDLRKWRPSQSKVASKPAAAAPATITLASLPDAQSDLSKRLAENKSKHNGDAASHDREAVKSDGDVNPDHFTICVVRTHGWLKDAATHVEEAAHQEVRHVASAGVFQ
jgi:hypothetical protein